MGEPMDRSRSVFGSLKPFDEVFPDVEDAGVEYTERGEFDDKVRALQSFHSIKHGGLIPCSNPLCRRGGFEIDEVLSAMRGSRQSEREGSLSCPGDEGSPKGRHSGKRCGNEIRYKLTVKYKAAV